ncbi:MAG: DUF2341 domain-containing protein [Candidatus Methanoperedens sp.]|nr:DUF2341 domain-containing protein [Candidatus Methanoperedens sp.]
MNNGKNANAAHTLAMGVVAALFIVSFAVTGMAAPALSNSGGGSWQYYKEIKVSNSGGELSDYQVLVQLSGSNFPSNVRSDGSDFRFTDASGTELNYWIESWDYAGRGAKIWVKVPSIAGGGSAAVRMYYGNPDSGVISNGDKVFEFFDDFETGNANKWSIIGSPQIGSEYAFSGNYGIRVYGDMTNFINKSWVLNPMAIEFRGKRIGGDLWGGVGITNDRLVGMERSCNKDVAWDTTQRCGSFGMDSNWHKYRVLIGSSETRYYADSDYIWTTSGSTGMYPNIVFYTAGAPGDGYIDDVFVRKYAFSEPTITLGAEQTTSMPTPTTPAPTTPAPTTSTPSTTSSEPASSAVLLHGEKTDVVLGEDVLLKLSAVNLITKPQMAVQVMIYPPSGMSVTSSEFVNSGAGIYTTTYSLNRGEGKDIEVRIKTNQEGDFNVKGRIVYYFGDNQSTAEDHTLNLPIKVRKEPVDSAQNVQKPISGFGIIIGIIGLLFTTLLKRRRG